MIRIFKDMFRRSDSHEFKPLLAEIESEPLNPLGRTLFWIIVALMICTFTWLFIGKVDVVISARGKVMPIGSTKTIQPLNTGIVKKILVAEGDYVTKGQTLVEIDPSTINPELESMKQNLHFYKLEVQRINALLDGKPFNPAYSYNNSAVTTQKNLYLSTMNSLSKKLEKQQTELKQVEEELQGSVIESKKNASLLKIAQEKEEKLAKVLDIIPRTEYQRVQSQIVEYDNNIKRLAHNVNKLNQEKEKINEEISFIKENFRVQNLDELSKKQKQITELSAKIAEIEFTSQRQSLKSPVDGHVDFLLIHTAGGVVTPAQELMKITPKDAPLTIKATLLNKDMGFIEEGMPVQIKIDTFNFQKYGILDGEVIRLSKDSKDDEKIGPVFEAYIKPLNKTLLVEGKEVDIKTGMSVNAEIKVGKRRIIEFFIYPLIKYWNESISIR